MFPFNQVIEKISFYYEVCKFRTLCHGLMLCTEKTGQPPNFQIDFGCVAETISAKLVILKPYF